MTMDGTGLVPGDKLRIERRYVVDGQLTTVTDEGRFAGIERVGSAEHLVLKEGKGKGKVRMFPLHAIAEITLVRSVPRAKAEATPAEPARTMAWDPSFA